MDIHIALLQRLNLLPTMKTATIKNSGLISRACERLIQVEHTLKHAASEAQISQDAYITWRPLYCKDIFIFANGKPNDTMVGVAAGKHCQFFCSQHSTVSMPTESAVVFMAHVTCDVLQDGREQMVILVYDILCDDDSCQDTPVRDRYANLLKHQRIIETTFQLGEAIFKVQWMGESSCQAKVATLQLPHEKCGIVEVGGRVQYQIHAV